jgi:hypothetical protein
MCTGKHGHWMRLLIHPNERDLAGGLVHWMLSMIGEQVGIPVYCSVRQYEGGVRTELEAAGFEPFASRVLLVKHTLAWSKTAAFELAPALQGGAEVAPPAYQINGESD